MESSTIDPRALENLKEAVRNWAVAHQLARLRREKNVEPANNHGVEGPELPAGDR